MMISLYAKRVLYTAENNAYTVEATAEILQGGYY
jgi:hypothetical protein